MVATRKQTEIQQAAIAHCLSPFDCTITGRGCTLSISKGQDVYSCKSDSSDETYYMAWNAARGEWECTCPATKPCKHIRGVCEVIAARKEQASQPDSQYARETFGISGDECAEAIEVAKQNMYGPDWRKHVRGDGDRYREFEFQCGSYSIPGLY